MSSKEEDIVGTRYQAPTSENTANLEDLLCAVSKFKVSELETAL
jgi:hypothetical protein